MLYASGAPPLSSPDWSQLGRVGLPAGLDEWARTAAEDEYVVVAGTLRNYQQPPYPRVADDWFEEDPVLFLEQSLVRLQEIERAKTATEDFAEPVLAELSAYGCVGRASGGFGGVVIEAPPSCVAALATQSEIGDIAVVQPVQPHRNDGTGIRAGHQVQQFLDNNLDGEVGTTRSAFGPDVLIGVTDQTLDIDHPAWLDAEFGPSRLEAMRCWLPTLGNFTGSYCTPEAFWDTSARKHGTNVAGQALADLTENQDGNQGDAWEAARTGMSTQSHLVFYGISGPSADPTTSPLPFDIIDQAIADGVDVMVRSFGLASPECSGGNEGNVDVAALRNAYLDGIFYVNSAGNDGNGGGCNVGGQASHPGVFTVGALKKNQGDLHFADIAGYSSEGGDVDGRNVVDIVAIGGRQSSSAGGSGTMATWDDQYGVGAAWDVGTSYAAPIVAGAAANFKHQMVNKLGASTINQPGRMHALMLLMGDRQVQGGSKSSTAMDPVWGAGRLAMRKFNNAGMDSPWAFHSARMVISEGQTIRLSASTGGVLSAKYNINPPLDPDVDELRLAAWWYEPNLSDDGTSPGSPANIRVRLKRVTTSVYSRTASSAAPQHRRVHLSSAGSFAWEVEIVGVDIPAGMGPPLSGVPARELHIAWFWEDSDRDDANGPAATIQ